MKLFFITFTMVLTFICSAIATPAVHTPIMQDDLIVKGKKFKLYFDKQETTRRYNSMQKEVTDSVELYANLAFLCKSHVKRYTVELNTCKQDTNQWFVTFIAPADAEYLNITFREPKNVSGARSHYPIYNQNTTFSHRTNKYRMDYARSGDEYKDIYMEDAIAYPNGLYRNITLWKDNYIKYNKQDLMKSEVDTIYNQYHKANHTLEDKMEILSTICDGYSLLNNIDQTFRALCELDSTLYDAKNKSENTYNDDLSFLNDLIWSIPTDTIAGCYHTQEEVVSKMLDIYEKCQNRYIIYEFATRSNAIGIIRSDTNISHRFSEMLFGQIKKDIDSNYLWQFSNNSSTFNYAMKYFNFVGEHEKCFAVAKLADKVLARFDRFIISQDTNDYASLLNGLNEWHSYVPFYSAQYRMQLGQLDTAKQILLDNMYVMGWQPTTVSWGGAARLFEIYKQENKIDSANYYIALAYYLGYAKAPYLYKDFWGYKKENGYDQFSLKDLIDKYNFSISDFTEVPEVTFNTNRGRYNLRNNSVEFKFVLDISDRCPACNLQLYDIMNNIKENFKSNNYHIIIITNVVEKELARLLEPNVFIAKRNPTQWKALGFNSKATTNTLIIQDGKTLLLNNLNVPDYFIKVKEILK